MRTSSKFQNVALTTLVLAFIAVFAFGDDAIQKAAKDGNVVAVQQAVAQGADKITPADALGVLDNVRQRAKFESTLADHVLIQKAVDTLKQTITDLDTTKEELKKANEEIKRLKDKYESTPAKEAKPADVKEPATPPAKP